MFSFIIINYNTSELTSACLKSIFKYCEPSEFEIILIDNNSKPEDLNLIKNNFGESVKIIANDRNLGFAKANNQGASMAQGDYLFFLNSDTLINSNILEAFKKNLMTDEGIGIIAPRLVLLSGKEQPYSYSINTKTKEMAWVSGAALAIRKKIFDTAGGWDEGYFMYFEDVDLCHSVSRLGYKMVRDLSSSIIHLTSGSPIPFWKRKFYYYRSKLIFILKNYLKLI
ncbi:MAG: glycosyltransferase family 2 protein [Patescibacteria group bacterium]